MTGQGTGLGTGINHQLHCPTPPIRATTQSIDINRSASAHEAPPPAIFFEFSADGLYTT